MTGERITRSGAWLGAVLLIALVFTGCHSASHPDYAQAVYASFDHHDLASVQVSQDRSKGVITLKGIVGDQTRKDRAQQLAQQAAPGYTIQNDIQVQNDGLLQMANPNAKPPEVEEMAHPPVGDNGGSGTRHAKPDAGHAAHKQPQR